MIENMLNTHLEQIGIESTESGAQRKLKQVATDTTSNDDSESVLKRAHQDIRSGSHHTQKVVKGFTVGEGMQEK